MSCVIVMGCYRSGTSAVAGILHHLGVDMGKNFQEPNHANPKGYFEDPDFISANLRIYKAMNQADDFEYHNGVFEAKEGFHELCRVRQLETLAEGGTGKMWGFKDPRFCVVAKHVVLPPDAKIIWIHRDIDETAMSIIKSLSLHGKDANMDKWRNFVEHYRVQTANYMDAGHWDSAIDINFNDLIRSPRTCINMIADFIGIDRNIPNEHTYDEHLTFEKIRKAYEFMSV